MGIFEENRFKINTRCTVVEKLYFSMLYKHPIAPTLIFGGITIVVTSLIQRYHPVTPASLLGTMVFGFFLWTFLEYLLHRFGEHTFPKIASPFFFYLHVEHHRDTQTPELILVQPIVVVSDAILLFSIFFLFTWNWALSLLVLAGVGLGYIWYEWVHYGTHRFTWNRGLLGYYKRYHLHHHFQQPDKAFGVTSPLWDHVFRTQI